jgi:hypothetical protein
LGPMVDIEYNFGRAGRSHTLRAHWQVSTKKVAAVRDLFLWRR